MTVQQRIGVVISTKMQKTIIIKSENRYPHQNHSKILIKSKKYLAHDELERAKMGDQVLIEECRPLSRRKCHKLLKILTKPPLIN